jgi:ankyrin repeat protein
MILGNKCDLKARREVQQEEGEVLAAKFGIKFIETNATKRYRGAIDIAIRTLSQDIKDKMDQQRHPETLLHFAVENKSHSAAEVLIAEKKADVNAADCNGRTALMIAAENNDWKSIYLLLQAGADTTLKNKYGDTAQQCAVSKRNHIPAVLMAEKTIQSLGDTDRIIALIAAVEEFDWTSVQKFLRSGVHTTLRDERGRTALHIAIEKGSYSATEFLIATKAHLNSVNNDGRTALMIAAVAETDKSDIIRELLRAGADTTIEDKDGRTALMIAGNSNSAVALLEAGSDIEMKDKDGKTALMIAAEKNARDITIELLRAGADMTIKDRNGRSALMIASEKDNSNTAIALLKAGADTTVKDKVSQEICYWMGMHV